MVQHEENFACLRPDEVLRLLSEAMGLQIWQSLTLQKCMKECQQAHLLHVQILSRQAAEDRRSLWRYQRRWFNDEERNFLKPSRDPFGRGAALAAIACWQRVAVAGYLNIIAVWTRLVNVRYIKCQSSHSGTWWYYPHIWFDNLVNHEDLSWACSTFTS